MDDVLDFLVESKVSVPGKEGGGQERAGAGMR
jgi:hypothetical protein